MTLLEQINHDMIAATKNNEPLLRDVLRLVKTGVKNKEISLGHELSDPEVVEVISKEVKQRQESITQFEAANRQELADREIAEIAVLKKYLPEQLDEAAILALVKEAVASTGATAMSDMGKVMAALLPQVKGKADGSLVSRLVREQLGA